jgi:hypothetical protein
MRWLESGVRVRTVISPRCGVNFDRVVQQVPQHLMHARRIDGAMIELCIKLQANAELFRLRVGGHHFHHVANQRVNVGLLFMQRILPLMTRLRSSRSSMSRVSNAMLRRIIATSSRMRGESSASDSMDAMDIKTGVSGVRSSWLRTARNWSFGFARLLGGGLGFVKLAGRLVHAGDILEDVDGADQIACGVVDRVYIDHGDKARAIQTFDDELLVSNSRRAREHTHHGSLCGGQDGSIEVVSL